MVHRYRDGRPPAPTTATNRLTDACAQAPQRIDAALEAFDLRAATAAVWTIVEEANRHIEHTRPWQLSTEDRDAALDVLLRACWSLGENLRPFLPDTADRIVAQCTPEAGQIAQCTSSAGRLPEPRPLFRRALGESAAVGHGSIITDGAA